MPALAPKITGWFAHKRPFAFEVDRIEWRDDAYRMLNGTFGVARLILSGETPLQVPPGVVEALLEACDDRGLLQARRDMLNLDDEVRILVGPFADRIARVARLDPRDRVELLLELLGRSVALTLPRSAVLKSA